jgi:calcineurin-like phosphoesterase family protein
MIITADLHLSSNVRDEYRWYFLEKFLPRLIKDHDQNEVVILGDLAEEKDFHKGELVNRLVDALVALNCYTVILKGNHDFLGDPTQAYWRFLRHIPELVWIDDPTEINDNLFLPYTPDYERDWPVSLKGEWIFAHQTFTGAVTEHGHKLEGIPHSALPLDASVISGDVHVPQTIGKVTYVGAPYTIDFGDDFEPRVLLVKGKKVRSIPCIGPQKRLVTGQVDADGLVFKWDKELNRGDIVKVRIELPAELHARWPEVQKAVRKWGDSGGYVIYAVQPMTEQADKRKVAHIDRPARSDKQLLNDYGKARQVPERTMKTGQFLMEKSK